MHCRVSMHCKISSHRSNHTLREGGVETSEVEEEEEDLAEEDVKLYAINVDNWAIMQEISMNLKIHVHIAKRRTTMWSNVPS